MTPDEDHFFDAVLGFVNRGYPLPSGIQVRTPDSALVVSRKLTMRADRGHLAEALFIGRGGFSAIRAKCHRMIWDFRAVDVETVPEFCEPCLMADTHVVYTFRGADGHALYVGQTGQPLTRLASHRASPFWFWAATSECQVVDLGEARRIESERILALDPPYNKNPRRRAA